MNDLSTTVVSSRIRLARSLSDHVFPELLPRKEGNQIIKSVYKVLEPLGDFKLYTMQNLPALDSEVMQEKHLISKNLLKNTDSGAVVLSSDETISIMINEEDHLREQCFMKGLSLEKAYETLNRIDDALLMGLNIAFDPTLGFLNSCITNVGTGMRASVMLFLPGLTLSKEIGNIINAYQNQGLAIRGVFGEGSDAQGYMFQVSNARSLGVSEKDIIAKITMSAIKISEAELAARQKLLKENEDELKDKVFRAYGTLTNAYTISSDEFMKCAGEVKMGIALGLIKLNDNTLIDRLIFDALPSTLTQMSGEEALTEQEEKKYRAQFVAKTLRNARIK